MNLKNFSLRGFLPLIGVAIVLAAAPPAFADPPECAPPAPGEPMLVTKDCVDPVYNQPFVDADEVRTTPVPHRRVHGGFTGTTVEFEIVFPEPSVYEGRFFQNTHPVVFDETISDTDIGFAADSGAYFVKTNQAGVNNALGGGYRINAAAAKFAETLAAEHYGAHDPYGYLTGGSGGAYQTLCAAEHTTGVWEGTVPFVMGTPNAIPNFFAVRAHALRVLRDKFADIADALEPGGSGDPYATLNAEEAAAFDEVTRMGFPPRGWFNHFEIAAQEVALLSPGVLARDPGYVSPGYVGDFFELPGYLGHDDPTGSLAAARLDDPARTDEETTVLTVIPFPPFPGAVIVAGLPAGADLTFADLRLLDGAGEPTGDDLSVLGAIPTPFGNLVVLNFGADPAVVGSLGFGTPVRFDNSRYLAMQTFHRHQNPPLDEYAWDQFRNPDGTSIYPQRPTLAGPSFAMNAGNCIADGDFHGKMILFNNLLDIDAFPWPADWYRNKVKAALGKKTDDRFRLWYNDNIQHGSPPGSASQRAHTVGYDAIIQQALRDVSAWVERGVKPPASTKYWVDKKTQVQVPPVLGLLRGGIQPVVTLLANGRERADVKVGDTVIFYALINLPPKTGKVVNAEWDFLGVGNYPVVQPVDDLLKSTVILKQTFTFTAPGTYFPVLRATSQRQGDPETPYARIQNLGRVRVVVE